ncbi:hypothetical protein [Enterobacter sp. SECR19-1250]|uniref:hypothetical protein n=1 Tax=Enterobacter sp. SECR19-1250 TaxID=2749084 RepID=UPI002115DF45|nr:hypothetical protein [Enterobacter sp. SECR19-1250]
MAAVTSRQPSPLQRSILIVLAALDDAVPGPVRTRDLERMLAEGGDRPVYGNNLRASCRRMEAAGWLRLLRAPNLQLAVELTDTGRELATPLLGTERERNRAEQRATDVRVLPVNDIPVTDTDTEVMIDGRPYQACRGDFVMRLDGRTCLQLTHATGNMECLEGDALQVAGWYRVCLAAGLPGHVQINEGLVPAVTTQEDPGPLAERQERKALNALLDRLARWHIHCNRGSLETLMFSPSRSPYESWQQRLQWLAIGENARMFDFYSDCSREEALPALMYLEETFGMASAEDFAAAVRWPVQEQ